jgi:hypothetical protein
VSLPIRGLRKHRAPDRPLLDLAAPLGNVVMVSLLVVGHCQRSSAFSRSRDHPSSEAGSRARSLRDASRCGSGVSRWVCAKRLHHQFPYPSALTAARRSCASRRCCAGSRSDQARSHNAALCLPDSSAASVGSSTSENDTPCSIIASTWLGSNVSDALPPIGALPSWVPHRCPRRSTCGPAR